MENFEIPLEKIEIFEYNTVIVGSGAAGLNCALHLVEEGIPPSQIAIITENLGGGTSFNAGSDKQTYYKLSLTGDQLDSPYQMAKDLFSGGAMHGDIALIESTNSIREFFHLIQLGVPFPHDEFGGYVGYKTDNDPKQRATSIGPYTSQEMSKRLLDVVVELEINIFDKTFAARILTENGKVVKAIGVICIDMDYLTNEKSWDNLIKSIKIFKAQNVVLAVGAPAILYKNSVYPESQMGTAGLAIEAGCVFQNLTESQFGIASKPFRWNLSGSYQQVIPRYVSMDNMDNQYEFLNNYFPSFKEVSKAIFLKGYQWPFNSKRVENYGSSLIDLAVYYETQILGRKVFLDYTQNPIEFNTRELDSTALAYLTNSSALKDLPYLRLKTLNEKAFLHFKEHGIDLSNELLEISVCNQHLNGGVGGDIWWESNIKHLFSIGEINGSHGIQRPGGAALNAGQVGGLRAAQKIGHIYNKNLKMNTSDYLFIIEQQLYEFLHNLNQVMFNTNKLSSESQKLMLILEQIQSRMDKYGGIIRLEKDLDKEIQIIENQFKNFNNVIELDSNVDIISYLRIKDTLLTQLMFFNAIRDYHTSFGQSRGSYLIIREALNTNLNEHYMDLPNELNRFRYIKNDLNLEEKVQTICLKNSKFNIKWVKVRELPTKFGWFETIWKEYSEDAIYKK